MPFVFLFPSVRSWRGHYPLPTLPAKGEGLTRFHPIPNAPCALFSTAMHVAAGEEEIVHARCAPRRLKIAARPRATPAGHPRP